MNGITSDRSGSRLPKWSRLECEGREGADQGLDIGDARRDGVEDLDWGKGPRQVSGSDLGDIEPAELRNRRRQRRLHGPHSTGFRPSLSG